MQPSKQHCFDKTSRNIENAIAYKQVLYRKLEKAYAIFI